MTAGPSLAAAPTGATLAIAGVHRAQSASTSRHRRDTSPRRRVRRRIVVERRGYADGAKRQQFVLSVVDRRDRRRHWRTPDGAWSDRTAVMEPRAGRDKRRWRI